MKKGFMKSLALLLAMLMTFSMFAVGASAAELKNISLSIGSAYTIKQGESVQIIVTATYSDYTSKVVTNAAFTSSDSTYVKVDGDGVMTGVKITPEGKPVTVTAYYSEGSVTMSASCAVTVVRKPVEVDSIEWIWAKTGLMAGFEYSFAYDSHVYNLVPDNADVKTATLTCSPASALQIDNEKKTFKVNPLYGKDELNVSLTLTADGASEKCQPVTKSMTIYKEIPLKGVSWDFLNGTTTPWYSYYSKEHSKQVEVYYFMPTDKGDRDAAYKWKVYPDNLSRESVLEMCDVTFTSSDPRVITFHVPTGRIIPVGNGTADITIKVVTPDGRIFSDTVTAGVYGSPYTPITSLTVEATDESVNCKVGEKDPPKVSLMFEHDYTLITKMNDGATFNPPEYSPTMKNGDVLRLVRKCDVKWKVDNDDVIEIGDNKDGSLSVSVIGTGSATITLTVNDNGEKIVKTVNVRGWMSWWEALIGLLGSLFTFHFGKVKMYGKAFGDALGDMFSGDHC